MFSIICVMWSSSIILLFRAAKHFIRILPYAGNNIFILLAINNKPMESQLKLPNENHNFDTANNPTNINSYRWEIVVMHRMIISAWTELRSPCGRFEWVSMKMYKSTVFSIHHWLIRKVVCITWHWWPGTRFNRYRITLALFDAPCKTSDTEAYLIAHNKNLANMQYSLLQKSHVVMRVWFV